VIVSNLLNIFFLRVSTTPHIAGLGRRVAIFYGDVGDFCRFLRTPGSRDNGID